MHKGLKAILIGSVMSICGTFCIIGLVTISEAESVQPYLYWYFLLFALVGIITLAGPAWIILSAPAIFSWIGMKFGIRVLAITIFILALIMSCLAVMFVIESMVTKSLHVHAVIGVVGSAVGLWYALFALRKKTSVPTE